MISPKQNNVAACDANKEFSAEEDATPKAN